MLDDKIDMSYSCEKKKVVIKMNNKKKIILPIIVGLLMVITVLGVTYAFFNYTRTGSANTVKVGRISFNHQEDNTINLTNVFPTSSTSLDNTNSDTVTINITGDTTYSKGIEYKVTLDEVNNTVNNKEVPISFKTTVTDLGSKSNDYWNERGSTTNVYNLIETGTVEEDKDILVGYIKPDDTGVNGSIDITAFIDSSNVAISDTVSRIEEGNLIYGETGGDWIAGREVLTTSEWNSMATNPISFKVRVEANEGIWVEEAKQYVLANLYNNSNWTSIRAYVTSVEFHKDGIVPENPITTIDVTDITSEGPVTLYTVDDGLGNGTYKAIVVADDVIYAPESSLGLFAFCRRLNSFDSQNFLIDRVSNMYGLFLNCQSLINIDFMLDWNVSNVTNMVAMLNGCTNLTNVNGLINWNTSSVNNMHSTFQNCSNLTNVDGLINWNTSNVNNMQATFQNCLNLLNVDGLINWNTSNVQNMNIMFYQCTNLSNVDGLRNWNTSSVNNMHSTFQNCSNLTNVDGLINWNTSNVNNMQATFQYCSNLLNVDGLINWNVSSVTNMTSMFYECTNLENFNGLSNWNTMSLVDMSYMFLLTDYEHLPILDANIFANWDVSNVTNMGGVFQNRSLNSYYPLRNWDVSKVQNFARLFNATSSSTITTLSGLENWNVLSATDMSYMFSDNFALTDASAINNWNINSGINFEGMFYHDTVHPEFTKVTGTWDSEGTFTPTT